MPLRKKRTAPWTPNGAGRRFHSASGTEKYNLSARFAGTSFHTREVLAGRFTEPCALLFALKARKPWARNARPYGDGTSPRMVNHPAQTPVQEEGVYGGTWFHSPPRMVRRGPRWNGLWSLHSWSSRRLARHWPRWQIARGPRCGAALRFRRSAAIVGGCEAPLLEGVTSAPSGRTEKFGPLCGKTGCGFAATHVPRRGTLVPPPQGSPSSCAVRGIYSAWKRFLRNAPFERKDRLGRAWRGNPPRAQIAPGPAFARMKRRSFSPSPSSEEGKATGLYKNGGGAVFLFHMKHFLAFPSAWV